MQNKVLSVIFGSNNKAKAQATGIAAHHSIAEITWHEGGWSPAGFMPTGEYRILSRKTGLVVDLRPKQLDEATLRAFVGNSYLANGWGDEIDSNKTKAGLGRTDDIKKGTYQLLKFGAYYRDGSPTLPIRGTLLTNLDPLFMYADYMEKLIDARRAPAHKFSQVPERPDHQQVLGQDLFYIYDAVLAFNKPVINDPLLANCFDFAALDATLQAGGLDAQLADWEALLP